MKNLLEMMATKELLDEKEKQKNHPKRIYLIDKELKKRR